MSANFAELRPGATVEAPALVLAAIRYQESGKIVHLMTPDWGKIHVYAAGAQNSRRRFGPALEPFSFIQAQVHFSRDALAREGSMSQILKADLRDAFLHFRTHSELLETGVFAVRLVDDFLPEGQADAVVFRTLGRFLRGCAQLSDPKTQAPWARWAFWSWMSRHLGFGELVNPADAGLPNLTPSLVEALAKVSLVVEPDFEAFLEFLARGEPVALQRRHELSAYETWSRASGIHWPYLEQRMRDVF
ncbi:MAG: DNA repair protein RecO [Bdellovibrionales bacterium]|nr:DNA repair protein RecO [Bdellovibrionales bacterium]